MKRIVVATLFAAMMVVLAACSSAVEATPQPVVEGSAEAAAQPTAASTAEESASNEEGTEAPAALEFAILPEESEARFIINEVLNGEPKTVIGVTQAVEGSFSPDFAAPANTTVGTFRIDLSTLQTDNNFRNRAIREFILQTGSPAFQYAEFTPTALTGLPETVTIGQPFDFQITGDLKLHDVTREVTFDVTATPVSETRIEGVATLGPILYSDYGISILRLPPQVASVEDQVVLELAFVAEPR